MRRKQFVFFASFLDAVEDLPLDQRGAFFDAVINYSLRGSEPEFDEGFIVAKAVFTAIKPVLDMSITRSKAGKAGGKAQAKSKQTESKDQAKSKQTESKDQAKSKQTESKDQAIGKDRIGKDRIGEDSRTEKPVNKLPSECVSFAEDFYLYLSGHGGKKNPTQKDITSGAETIDKLVRLDGWDLQDEIAPAMRWGVMDTFWSKQVRSLSPLRKKGKNGETKFSNLFSSYSARGVSAKITPRTVREQNDAQCSAIAKILLEDRANDRDNNRKESGILLER